MKTLVYIVAPYGAPTYEERTRNVERACQLNLMACDAGYAPMLVHAALHGGAYGSDDDPAIRARGLEIDLAWVEAVWKLGGELWVLLRPDGTLSSGSAVEVRHWRKLAGLLDDRGAYDADAIVECTPDWLVAPSVMVVVENPAMAFEADADGPAFSDEQLSFVMQLEELTADSEDDYVTALHHYVDLFEDEEPGV